MSGGPIPTTRVAVVVPTHNDGALAVEAVDSVAEQEPVEIIVVDDGSDDPESLRRLDGLRERGVRVVRQENAGPAAARNAGVAATRAPLVFFLDADDLLEPGALGRLADLLERHPEAAAAWGDYVEFGAIDRRCQVPSRLLPWSTTYVNLYAPSCLLRRDVLAAIGGWPVIGYEDWGLYIALVEHSAGGVHAGEVVYRRRIQGDPRRLSWLRRNHLRLYRELRATFPAAFAQRARWARVERPALWKRILYPLLFGPRLLLPAGLEDMLRRSRVWSRLRAARR